DAARAFKQKYQAGEVRPQIAVRAGSGEVISVALANDADNYLLEYIDGEFMTATEKKKRGTERERLIYTDPSTGLQWVRNGNIAMNSMIWDEAIRWVKTLDI